LVFGGKKRGEKKQKRDPQAKCVKNHLRERSPRGIQGRTCGSQVKREGREASTTKPHSWCFPSMLPQPADPRTEERGNRPSKKGSRQEEKKGGYHHSKITQRGKTIGTKEGRRR